jgi:hypothetical protein
MGVWTVEPTEMVMVISSGRQLQVWCQLSKPVTYIYDVYEPLGQVLLVNLPQSTFGMHIQVTNVSPRTFKGQASVLSDLPGPVILRGAFKVGLWVKHEWTVQYFNLLLYMGICQPPKEHCVAAISTLAMFVSNII